jgi:hypothetical protein
MRLFLLLFWGKISQLLLIQKKQKKQKTKKTSTGYYLVTKLGTYGARQTLGLVGSYFSLLID